MKKILLLAMGLLLSSFIFAQDAEVEAAAETVAEVSQEELIVGDWVGEYKVKKQTVTAKMTINADGTCKLYSDANGRVSIDGSGTWKFVQKGDANIFTVDGKELKNIKPMKPVVTVEGDTLTFNGNFFFGAPKVATMTRVK